MCKMSKMMLVTVFFLFLSLEYLATCFISLFIFSSHKDAFKNIFTLFTFGNVFTTGRRDGVLQGRLLQAGSAGGGAGRAEEGEWGAQAADPGPPGGGVWSQAGCQVPGQGAGWQVGPKPVQTGF